MVNEATTLTINVDHTCIPAVCEVNGYVHPSLGVCTACPTNSTSAGGTPSMCTCNAGTGRVNEADVTLPCLGECGNTCIQLIQYVVVSGES